MAKQQVYDGTLNKYIEIDVSIPEEDTELTKTNDSIVKRGMRNDLLKDSDWVALADCQLTDSQKTEANAYRQSLRDLPSHTDFPYVDFPNKPSFL
tara:strand:- start:2166 stop:2450 length:285 start_codon:yes stop_codon:yes gene_type:complete